jgi:hypothetical protein
MMDTMGYDCVIGTVFIQPQRMQFMRYVISHQPYGYQVVTRAPVYVSESIQNRLFKWALPFTRNLWLVILCSIISSAVIMTIFEHDSAGEDFPMADESWGRKSARALYYSAMGVSTCVCCVCGQRRVMRCECACMCVRACACVCALTCALRCALRAPWRRSVDNFHPQTNEGRMYVSVKAFVFFVIMSSYTAQLTGARARTHVLSTPRRATDARVCACVCACVDNSHSGQHASAISRDHQHRLLRGHWCAVASASHMHACACRARMHARADHARARAGAPLCVRQNAAQEGFIATFYPKLTVKPIPGLTQAGLLPAIASGVCKGGVGPDPELKYSLGGPGIFDADGFDPTCAPPLCRAARAACACVCACGLTRRHAATRAARSPLLRPADGW